MKPLISVDPLMKKIIVKVNIDVSRTLMVLEDIRKLLARILGVIPAALRLITVEKDCVVTFQLVGALADSGLIFCGDKDKIFTQAKIWKLQALSIRRLICGDYDWDLTPGNHIVK